VGDDLGSVWKLGDIISIGLYKKFCI